MNKYSELTFNKQCPFHKNHKITFVCINSFCKKRGLGCVFCIKKNHSNCKKDFILDEALVSRVMEIKKGNDINEIKVEISKIIEKNFDFLKTIMETKKKEILNSFNAFENDLTKISLNNLIQYKKNSIITKKKNKIILKNSISSSKKPLLEKDLNRFRQQLKQKLSAHLDLFRSLKFRNKIQLTPPEFLTNKFLTLTQHFNTLKIKKKKSDSICSSILLEKLTTIKLKIKIRISEFSSNLEFGLINENTIKKQKSKLGIEIGQKISNEYFFNSYSQINLSGVNKNISVYDFDKVDSGILDGMDDYTIFVEFNRNKKLLRVYSTDCRVDLENKNVDTEHNLFFFVSLRSEGSEVCIERLE